MFKEYLYELEKTARYTLACTCGAIACMIDLAICIPGWISDGLAYVAKRTVHKYETEGKYAEAAK